VGRFLLLRASITAVVNSAPFEERAALAVGVVLVVVCEGILLVLAKHLFSSHFAHYIGGRMSSLVLRKVARLGVRPMGVEETQFVGADLPQACIRRVNSCTLNLAKESVCNENSSKCLSNSLFDRK